MVQAGSDEILRGDAERLVERLEAHGVPVHFRLGRDLWHVWHLFAGLVPEATAAVRGARRVRQHDGTGRGPLLRRVSSTPAPGDVLRQPATTRWSA